MVPLSRFAGKELTDRRPFPRLLQRSMRRTLVAIQMESAMSVQAIDTPAFIPAAPARLDKPASQWSQLFGAASRNLVQWWTAESFRSPVTSNTVMGATYHAINDPEAVRRVLLDNVANYPKPSLLPRVFPLIVEGL